MSHVSKTSDHLAHEIDGVPVTGIPVGSRTVVTDCYFDNYMS